MVLIGTVLALQLSAQQEEQQPVLTFEQAIKLALKNSVLLNMQRNNLELSQAQKVASIAGIAPNVTLNGSMSQINGNSFNPNVGQVVNGIRDNVTGSVNANMNLFSGFSRINSIRQYTNALEAQSYFVNRTAQDVMNTVSTQYLRVMLDEELLRIAKENFEALNKQLDQVREQVNLGARSQVDEYNQDALTKGAELRMVQAQITRDNDKALLAQTLLMDPFERFDVERPNWDVNEIGTEQPNAMALAEQAKQFRGDYMRARKAEEAAKYATRAYKGFMMPSLFAFGTYGSAYNYQHNVPDSVPNYTLTQTIVNDPSAASGYSILNTTSKTMVPNSEVPRPFSEQFRKNNTFKQYGVQLQIPLFNGLQNRTAYVQQKVLYMNAQVNTKNFEFQIRNDVVRAVYNFNGAKKAFAVTTDQLKSADMAFQFETERYNLGVTNFVDYTNANRVFIQAQTDKAQAEYTLVFQRIMLAYAVGTLSPEQLQK